jgi:hypothetical protein
MPSGMNRAIICSMFMGCDIWGAPAAAPPAWHPAADGEAIPKWASAIWAAFAYSPRDTECQDVGQGLHVVAHVGEDVLPHVGREIDWLAAIGTHGGHVHVMVHHVVILGLGRDAAR